MNGKAKSKQSYPLSCRNIVALIISILNCQIIRNPYLEIYFHQKLGESVPFSFLFVFSKCVYTEIGDFAYLCICVYIQYLSDSDTLPESG